MNIRMKKYLIMGVTLIMVASAVSIFLPGYYNNQQTSINTGPAQISFEKSLTTGSTAQMSTENYSAVQQQLSQYAGSPMQSTQQISFLVNFNVQNMAALNSYINLENNRMSPYYHHYLAASAFMPGAKYGPSQTAYNDAIQYYTNMGFSVVKQYNLGIEFSGTVSQVNSAFNTTMMNYNINGSMKFANNGPLQVPSVIAGSISSIDGLTNLLQFAPTAMAAPSGMLSSTAPGGITSNAVTSYLSQSQVLNYSRHSYAWANVPGYGLTQFMFPTTMPVLYNATGLINQGYNGTGITIAVVMEQGYNPSDLQNFAQEVYGNPYQITNRITSMPVNGAAPIGAVHWGALAGGAGEFTLDIQYSSTMAPAAHIDAVYGPDLSTMSLDASYQTLAFMPKVPNIVTNSWGGDEAIWFNLYGASYQNAYTMNSLFAVLDARGSTVLFSSGDSAGVGFLTNMLTPAFGSSSPYVVGVGGVRTVANSSKGEFPTGNVSNFTLAPYANQSANGGFWFTNYPLQVANATSIATQSYWYTPGFGGVPFAGGQVGVSYWFNQSAYQHGLGVPNYGRQNSVTVSGEADFNETEYFNGMWVFFWGGTSFACPTVAGQFADILSYTNQTVGVNYTGNLDPWVYQLGNFQSTFPNNPFYSVSNGSNPWAAANQNVGWPNDMTYPANWTLEHSGYTTLTGWGTINTYNFAHALAQTYKYNLFLNNTTMNNLITSVTGVTLNSGVNYGLNVVNFSAVSGPITVNITVYDGNGNVVGYNNTTTTVGGTMNFNTTGYGGDLAIINIQNTGNSNPGNNTWFYVYINKTLYSGQLNVTVLQNNVMGGLAAYNPFLSYGYPGFAPLMPNTVEVKVTLNGTPVANAYVLASQINYSPFSPWGMSPLPYETPTPLRSVGFTNASGIAFVETWNVMDNVTYNITAYYHGLSNNTSLNVMPQYFVNNWNNFALGFPTQVSGFLELPSVTAGTSYNVSLQITNFNTTLAMAANVSVGWYMPYPTFQLQDMTGITQVGPSGQFNLTINSMYTPGLYFINVTQPGKSITWYDGFAMNTPSTYMPLLITGNVGANFVPVSPSGLIASPFTGQGWVMEGSVYTYYTNPFFGFSLSISGNTTNGPTYSFDGMTPQVYPIGVSNLTDPQNTLAMNIAIPTNLPAGENTFTVNFSDDMYNLNYSSTFYFWIISNTSSTAPSSTIGISTANSPSIAKSGTSYYTGDVQFLLNNSQMQYTTSTLNIANAANTVDLTFDVTGLSTFTYNFGNLGAGAYTVTYTSTNYNGEVTTASMLVNTASAYTVTFTESGLSSGTSWNVTFGGTTHTSTTNSVSFTDVLAGSYSYSVGNVNGFSKSPGFGTVTVNGNSNFGVAFSPSSYTVKFTESGLSSGTSWNVVFNGTTYNSTTSTITVTGVSSGTYSYSFGSVSGYTTPASGSLSVSGNSNVNGAYSSSGFTTSTLLYVIGGVVGGLVIGSVVVYFIARKPTP